MNRHQGWWVSRLAGAALVLGTVASLHAQAPVTQAAAEVNKKMVKIFGGGGFKGLPGYGTGILVSPKGYILTVNNHLLSSTHEIRVHLYDGRLARAKVVSREPELDVALLKIEDDVDFLPCFDIAKEAARPAAAAGDWVLALSNQFQIATRDEPMSVQRGVVAAHAPLRGRRGVFEAPFVGEVYFLDAIVNNPGAAGGAVATRKGELLGVIGRELKNTLSDTWINYAVPVQSVVDVQRGDKSEKVSMASFVKDSIDGKYKQSEIRKVAEDKGGYHGIVLVVNAVSATPPYVEEVVPGSPAAKVGLRPDDLIVYIEGELVPTIAMFKDQMKRHGPGEEVKMQVQRGTKLESVRLKLADRPKIVLPPAVGASK